MKLIFTVLITYKLRNSFNKMFEVAGFGNPLLDITVQINNNTLIKKYNLKEDGQTDVSASTMLSLYNDIALYPNQKSPGGCAQNTLRVLQWLLQKPQTNIFFGGIGNDKCGEVLTNLVQQSGICTKYLIHKNQSTGTCVALVNGSKRSLIAHLGAAEIFNVENISDETLDILQSVKICYIEGYFLSKRLPVANYLKNIVTKSASLLAFNLCGSYFIKLYPYEILHFAETCDILFGNYEEFSILGEILNKEAKDVAISLNKSFNQFKSHNYLFRFNKTIVITNGSEDIFCVFNKGEIVQFKVPFIPENDIRDTTGAGDSFVAGFLAALLHNYDINICLKTACWTAGQIIQQLGCTLPNFVPKLDSVINKL